MNNIKDIPEPSKRTIVLFDTCAYRTFVNGKSTDEIYDLTIKLRSCENEKQITVYVLAQTLWELLTHIPAKQDIISNLTTATNSDVLNNIEERIINNPIHLCKNALYMAGIHAKSLETSAINFIPLVQLDLSVALESNFAKNTKEYNNYLITSNTLKELVESFACDCNYLDSIDKKSYNKLVSCAADLLYYKAAQNANLQKIITDYKCNSSKDKPSEKDFIAQIKNEFEDVLTHCILDKDTEKMNIEKICPISFQFIEAWARGLYQAMNNNSALSEEWAEKRKKANGIVDAMVLTPLSCNIESQSFIIVSEDKEILSNREYLKSSNHEIFNIEEYKNYIGLEDTD